MCSSWKYPFFHGGHFHFRPHPLEFPWFSNLIVYPLERIFPSKTLLHHIIMQKIIVFAIKWEKKFIHVKLLSNNLDFTL